MSGFTASLAGTPARQCWPRACPTTTTTSLLITRNRTHSARGGVCSSMGCQKSIEPVWPLPLHANSSFDWLSNALKQQMPDARWARWAFPSLGNNPNVCRLMGGSSSRVCGCLPSMCVCVWSILLCCFENWGKLGACRSMLLPSAHFG